MRCKDCGKEISENATLCPHCGAKTLKGELDEKNKALRIKQWIHTGMFLVGIILFVLNVGTLVERYDEWEIADGIIRDIWGSTKVTFLEYLGVHDERGVFWATIFGAILAPWGALGALVNRGRYKNNIIIASNEKILYGSHASGETGREENLWTCAACGQVNLKRVAFCQKCGVAQSWSTDRKPTRQAAVCPNCGSAINDDHVFCMGCGSRVAGR